MFGGVSNHGRRTACYADALLALEAASRTPTGKTRAPKADGYPLGGHSKSVTWVRQCDDGSVAFQLYSTDVVVWHPDNSVEIDNYGTTTTSSFAARFLPNSIALNVAGNTISYATEAGRYAWSGNVCRGKHNVATFREHDNVWLPDEDTLTVMDFPEFDRATMRGIAKAYPWKDFDAWLSMAPMHLDLEHQEFDTTTCRDALLERNFRRVAEHLPTVKVPRGFGLADRMKPLKIAVRGYDTMVTLASIRKLKLALCQTEGGLTSVPLKTVSRKEFDRRMKRVREISNLGLCGYYEYGPG